MPRASFLPRRARATLVAGIAAAAALGVLGPAPVAGAQVASGSSQPISIFVTSPPDPVPATPGATVMSSLTVGNLGPSPVDVTIGTRAVRLLDNGKTRFEPGPDPRFAGLVTIAPNALHLASRSERTVQVSVRIPRGLSPDDYFLGVLVSPVVNGPSVSVENDIGGLVVLDVPGPRHRQIAAHFEGPSWLNLSLSSSATGAIRVASIGTSTVAFTTTQVNSGWPSPDPRFVEVNAQLLPPGLSRDVPVHVSSWLGLGWYTIHATLVYDKSAQQTGEVTLSKTVLVLNPLWLLLVPLGVSIVAWRRRRKRSSGPKRPSRPRGAHSARRSRRPPRPPAPDSPGKVGAPDLVGPRPG